MEAFRPFGPDHLVVLGGLAAGVAALVAASLRLRTHDDRRLRRAFAIALLGNELVAAVIAWRAGVFVLPLHLCDLALFVTVWTLWRPGSRLGPLAFFWGVAGGLQALLTPDLRAPFPTYWWTQFFTSHGGTVLAAVYLAAAGHVRPTGRSVWWAWAAGNIYAALVGLVNWLAGTNFGYLARKPDQPSLLDALGPWPYYILGMEAMMLGSFVVLYAPFAVARLQQTQAGGR